MHRIAGLSVLLVEDEALIAMDVSQLLANTKCRVIGPCRDVACALEAIEREHIDCAILDVKLGREHTLHLADALAERGVPLVWMSGYERQVLPARYRDRPFVPKPFVAQDLFDALGEAISGGR